MLNANPNGRPRLAAQPMDEEAARRYRQRVFQMGLLVCLVLLFIDQKNGRDNYGGNRGGDDSETSKGADEVGEGGIPEGKIRSLNEFLRLEKGDSTIYPRNATGYYRGGWSKMLHPPSVLSEINDTAGNPHLTLHHTEGRFDMQLYMNNIAGVTDLSLVYGYFKLLDGAHSSERDIYSVAKGVYLHKTGRLLLRTMTQADANNIAFTFAVPSNSTNATSTSIGGEGGKSSSSNSSNKKGEPITSRNRDVNKGINLNQPLHQTFYSSSSSAAAARTQAPSKPGRVRAGWEKQAGYRIDDEYYDEEEKDSFEEALSMNVAGMGLGRRTFAAHNGDDDSRFLMADDGEGGGDEDHRQLAFMRLLESAAKNGGLKSLKMDDMVIGLTTYDENAEPEPGVESVLIPNRSKNQYIRQTTSNGRKCVFQLDAFTAPKNGTSKEGEKGSSSPTIGEDGKEEDRMKWVDGLEGILSSPNCHVAMNVTSEAIRLDWGKAYRKAVNYSIVVTLVCVLQIALLFRQLYYSRTQAAASRVSLLTIGQQAILDALLCIAHLLLCAMLQPLFAAFASIAFFKLVIFSIFEIRYMFIIHQSRNSQSANAASFNGLRRQLATLHARFYAILFFILFLIYFLANYLEVIIFLLYSFWVPQIVTNAMKGVRQPLNRTYVIGMSIARLVIPLYIYGCPQNFVHLLFNEYKPDYKMCALLVFWLSLQVVVLLSQDVFGPQYMIPARFLPPKYNYYRPIPQGLRHRQSSGDEIEMTAPTDIESGDAPECVICYNNIDVTTGYMVSPCDHLFHRECLERWMDIKLECPVCRQTLPSA